MRSNMAPSADELIGIEAELVSLPQLGADGPHPQASGVFVVEAGALPFVCTPLPPVGEIW